MAYQSFWFNTNLPEEIVKIIENDVSKYFDDNLDVSKLDQGIVDYTRRKSKNAWIPSTHWITGFLWHYVQKVNTENFLYDLTCIDAQTLQYTLYEEGNFYNWHTDTSIKNYYTPISNGNVSADNLASDFINKNSELVRKLSFSLQLSDPEDYDGGQLQLLDEEGKSYIVPKTKGTLIFFDSRTSHRVRKVTRGVRKSIVGWVVGPRWR